MKHLRSIRSNLLRATALGTSVLALSACGSGMASKASSLTQVAEAPTAVNPTPAPVSSPWNDLSMNGSPARGDFKATQVVSIDKTKKEFVLRLPMPPSPYFDGTPLMVSLQKPPGASVGLEALTGGGTALTFRVPLVDILKGGVDFPAASKLPNGDPLPAVADGSLPSEAITLNKIGKINATLYFGTQQLAIFVNTPFDPMFFIQIPIMNETGTRTWGYLTSIPAKKAPATPADGGFFISVQIPDDIARIIDDNL